MKNTNCENSGLLTNLSKIFANIVGNADHLLEYWIYIHNNKGIQSPPEQRNANKWKIFSSLFSENFRIRIGNNYFGRKERKVFKSNG